MLTCLVSVLFTFYIQGAEIKKKKKTRRQRVNSLKTEIFAIAYNILVPTTKEHILMPVG